jgi:hypothetical protein
MLLNCVAITCVMCLDLEFRQKPRNGSSTYYHRCDQQRIIAIVVRLACIQPYEDVDGEGLHSSKQFPLTQLQMLELPFSRLLVGPVWDRKLNVLLHTNVHIPFAHCSRTAFDSHGPVR